MIKDALKAQLGFTHYAVTENVEAVSHEDSLESAERGGNSLNWVLGHIVASRTGMLRLLGGEPTLPDDRRRLYARGSAAIGAGSDCVPFEELRRRFEESQRQILEKLEAADDALWSRQVPGLFDPDAREPLGVQLAAFVFHESYHAGQLGVIRRAIGKAAAIA